MCGAGARPQIYSGCTPSAVGSTQAYSVPDQSQWALKSYSHAQHHLVDEKQRLREVKTYPRSHGPEASEARWLEPPSVCFSLATGPLLTPISCGVLGLSRGVFASGKVRSFEQQEWDLKMDLNT